MATENLTVRNLEFTTSTLYQLSPDAQPMDVIDHLLDRLDQLHSLLFAQMDGGFSESMGNDKAAMCYLRACQSLAHECNELAGLMGDAYEPVQCKLEGLMGVLYTAREQFVKETTGIVQAQFMGACTRMASECYEAIRALSDVRVAA